MVGKKQIIVLCSNKILLFYVWGFVLWFCSLVECSSSTIHGPIKGSFLTSAPFYCFQHESILIILNCIRLYFGFNIFKWFNSSMEICNGFALNEIPTFLPRKRYCSWTLHTIMNGESHSQFFLTLKFVHWRLTRCHIHSNSIWIVVE